MFDMCVKWPNGNRVAVMLTSDFDAETLWMSRDPENTKRGGVPGTFLVPGWTVERHTGRVEMIVRAGHEIGHHSYSHRWAGDSFEKEIEEMERGLEALKRTVEVVPNRYRSPAGEVSRIALLREMIAFIRGLVCHRRPGSRDLVVPKQAGLSAVRARWAAVCCFLGQGVAALTTSPLAPAAVRASRAFGRIGDGDTVGGAPNPRAYR